MNAQRSTSRVTYSVRKQSDNHEIEFNWESNPEHSNPFRDAYVQFRNYLGYTKPLSYDEWVRRPADDKAVILYVQFYDQITLAWYKAHKLWGDPEEGVETVLLYLFNKNVHIIEEQPARFTPNYMYRVAYNCLYCICHDRKCDKDRWELETSNIVMCDGEELDLHDTIPKVVDMDRESNRERFWRVVESFDEETQSVIGELLGEPTRGRKRKIADDRRFEIMNNLKSTLAEFHDIFCD